MSVPNTGRVAVGAALVTGAIFVAPTTAPLPTDATTALSSAYKCLGFTSDEGITISESSSNQSLRVWEGRVEARNTRTEYTEQLSFTPVECNEDVAKFTWGDGHVTVGNDGSLAIQHHGGTMEPVHIVIETVPFAGAVARYCAKAQLTERGDMTGNGQDFSGRQATMNCLANEAGTTMTEYVAFTGSAVADVALSALTIGSLELTPTFAAGTTAYAATTTDSSATVTATPHAEGAGVVVVVNGSSIASGGTANWKTGANDVAVTVTNGGMSRTYHVSVNKTSA